MSTPRNDGLLTLVDTLDDAQAAANVFLSHAATDGTREHARRLSEAIAVAIEVRDAAFDCLNSAELPKIEA